MVTHKTRVMRASSPPKSTLGIGGFRTAASHFLVEPGSVRLEELALIGPGVRAGPGPKLGAVGPAAARQQRLNFNPLPQGQGSFRPVLSRDMV
jgi:hypothetical protein